MKDIEITNNDGSVNFSALIEYRNQNKAYTSKNMLRIKANIQLTNQNSNTNTNPSTISSLVSQAVSCLIRWGIRKRLDNINQITQDIGLNQLNLNSSIAASTDNTKLSMKLGYNNKLGCILGSTLPLEETIVNLYEDIDTIITNIISSKKIAKNARFVLTFVIKTNHLLSW